MSIEFLITSLVVVLAPGTGVLYTLAIGLAKGARASVAAAFGCTLGIVPHMAAAILGLAAVLHASATAFQLLKFAGVAYLLYMAWTMLKQHGALSVEPDAAAVKTPLGGIAVKGILINILNPKLSIFFLAFLPQFVSVDADNATAHMVLLSAVFMAMTFVIFVGYGFFAAFVRRHVISRPAVLNWMRRAFAGAFVVLGGRLLLAER